MYEFYFKSNSESPEQGPFSASQMAAMQFAPEALVTEASMNGDWSLASDFDFRSLRNDEYYEYTKKDDEFIEKANHDMIIGALSFIVGAAVTYFTYQSASGGGTYIIAWGAILFGGIQFFRGLINRI